MGLKDIWESLYVVDRIVQQAFSKSSNPLIDPYFSERALGFEKGRNAHQAIELAEQYYLEESTGSSGL